MSKVSYSVRLIYPSGTVKDVLFTDYKDEAEQYIAQSKERRPRIRHQLGTHRKREASMDFGYVCQRDDFRAGEAYGPS